MFRLSRCIQLALAAAATGLSGLAPYVTISAQTPAVRQASAAAPASKDLAPFDAAARRAVIDNIETLLGRHYVDADTGKLIANHLAARLKAGAYDAVSDPYRFAELVTTDLRAVNGDKHLVVQYDPTRTAERPGPEGIRMFGPPSGGPAAGGPPQGGRRQPPPDVVAAARRNHFGLGKVDVLPGNLGYLEIRGFSGADEAQEVLVDALRYLKYTDAIIFDLRRNGGGSAEMVNFLISHVTGPDTLASLTVTNRSGGEHFTRYTLASVPGPRRTDVPVYVLTSGFTASAGEDFAFVLKNLGRATIVGAPSAGAGHNNALLDAGRGFAVSVSFTRVADPKTGAEWERIGVQPNVVVDQANALLTAQSLALKTLADQAGGDRQRQAVLTGLRETIDAQLHPHAVAPATLASYAGEYEGGRAVKVVGETLAYRSRPGAPEEPLVALSDTVFANGAIRISFEKGGTQMRVAAGESALTYGKIR
jgi:hypothetical protein